MIYIVRHRFFGTIQIESPYSATRNQVVKTLIFHHPEDVDNYIRNNVSAANLVKLEMETAEAG